MTETEQLMHEWLKSDDHNRVAHAMVRIAIGFGPIPNPYVQLPVSVPLPTKAQLIQVNACLYRQCPKGCQRSYCWAYRKDVSVYDCVACLEEMNNG